MSFRRKLEAEAAQSTNPSVSAVEAALKKMLGDRGDLLSSVKKDNSGNYTIVGRASSNGNMLDVTDFTTHGIHIKSPKTSGRSASCPGRLEFTISVVELDAILFGNSNNIADKDNGNISSKRNKGHGGR